MSKKINPKATTRLSELKKGKPKEKIGLIGSNKSSKITPTSFRITIRDRIELKNIQKEVNKISAVWISETKIIKALIQAGKQMDKRIILKEIAKFPLE